MVDLETDIRVLDVMVGFGSRPYRTPLKFGGHVVREATTCNVVIAVETLGGQRAEGFGSMPLGNNWAYPSQVLSSDETLTLIKEGARRIGRRLQEFASKEWMHPVEIAVQAEALMQEGAARLEREWELTQPIPKLAQLVALSPFDAALHDAFGKANGISCYQGYGREFMTHDLEYYLDAHFRGEYLGRYVLSVPRATMPLYHLVGALDPLTAADVTEPVGDGLPETLEEWIRKEGLTHIKIKLNGDDMAWDVERVLAVDRIASEAGLVVHGDYRFSLDFNETAGSEEYVLEMLARTREGSPTAFDRIQYIEQPTGRDLAAHPEMTMRRAAALKPVVIDESLVGYDSLTMAMDMGYSGVALKTCKGHSQSLILGAAAQKYGMFLCVQDLTCTGAAYLHSVSFAAHIPGVAAVEGNGRQYCPTANSWWQALYPRAFEVQGGRIETIDLAGTGLGFVPNNYQAEGVQTPGATDLRQVEEPKKPKRRPGGSDGVRPAQS